MSAPRRVLYIQHAGALGGSAVSLLTTMRFLDPSRYRPVIALARPTAALERYYRAAGVETIPCQGLALWDHSTVAPRPLHHPRTWRMYWRLARNWPGTPTRTLRLVESTGADLVHLNSMPLSATAAALSSAGVPFVWHVREPPYPGRGLRYRIIRSFLRRADARIFISAADRDAWMGGPDGEVIPNFVDVASFRPDAPDLPARESLGLEQGAAVVLYLGGLSEAKGILLLLDALPRVAGAVPQLRCLMPGLTSRAPRSPARSSRTWLRRLAGAPALTRRVGDAIERGPLASVSIPLPFTEDVRGLVAASDVVVFPAVRPHFARPVIEAAAMGKPVVASRFPVLEELVVHGQTGVLVAPGDAEALAEALRTLLLRPDDARSMGARGRARALEAYDARSGAARIMEVYDRVLGRSPVQTGQPAVDS